MPCVVRHDNATEEYCQNLTQTPLLMLVMNMVFTFQPQTMRRSVVFVDLNNMEYFVVPLVNLF